MILFTGHHGTAVTLDFQAGLIRHVEATDDDGVEWADNIAHVSQVVVPSQTGIVGLLKCLIIIFYGVSKVTNSDNLLVTVVHAGVDDSRKRRRAPAGHPFGACPYARLLLSRRFFITVFFIWCARF